MSKARFFWLCVVDVLMVLLAPILVAIALIFATKTDQLGTHHGQPPIQRYRLRWPFRWLETPDELLPGGLYEPTVKKIYDKWGWRICSWYWLGIRNQAHGMWWKYGKEVPKNMKSMTKAELKKYGLEEINHYWGPIKIVTGWKTYRDWHSVKTKMGYWAMRRFTVRWEKKRPSD